MVGLNATLWNSWNKIYVISTMYPDDSTMKDFIELANTVHWTGYLLTLAKLEGERAHTDWLDDCETMRTAKNRKIFKIYKINWNCIFDSK